MATTNFFNFLVLIGVICCAPILGKNNGRKLLGYNCLSEISSNFDGTTMTVQSSLSTDEGCSTDNLYIVFHANFVGKLKNVVDGTVICFDSSITGTGLTPSLMSTSSTCLTLVSGASNPSIGNPWSITIDPNNVQGVLIGFATYKCGTTCPTNLDPTWTITETLIQGYADLSSANWQWSAAAYQVDTVDTSNIKIYASNCDGYPTTQTQCHVAGGRGGGGSNYCGSWSGTKSLCSVTGSPSTTTTASPTPIKTTASPTSSPTPSPTTWWEGSRTTASPTASPSPSPTEWRG